MDNKRCDHCNAELKPRANSPILADGFLDTDTGQNVCLQCKPKHYKLKKEAGMEGLFSEMPIVLPLPEE